MAVAPYNLKNKESNSEKFYKIAQDISKKLYANVKVAFADIINDYERYISGSKVENLSMSEEYLSEFLLIGLFWNRYISYAANPNFTCTCFSAGLNYLRNNKPEIKPETDKIRVKLLKNYLLKHSDEEAKITRENFISLIDWLSGIGEFREEVERLEKWEKYFSALPDSKVSEILSATINYYANFLENELYPQLHEFTDDFYEYIEKIEEKSAEREDIVLLERTPEEYHFNILAVSMNNLALRAKFDKMPQKIVLMPDCMCYDKAKCEAENNSERKCNACEIEKCNIGKVKNEIGDAADVVLVTHQSGFAKRLEKWKNSDTVGLVGVSCVVCSLNEFYNIRKMNINCQQMYLDSCSCKKHWNAEKGIPTMLNIDQLKRILNS